MTQYLHLGLLGLGSGALFALAALGLVLVYRSSGVVNFAHGAIGMAGAFAFYDLTVDGGVATAPAAALAVMISAGLGLLTYVLTSLGRRASNLTRVIGTLAILLILQSLAALRYGTDPHLVRTFLPHGVVTFGGGVSIGADRLLLFGVALVLTGALSLVYRRTRFGLATSAVSESPRSLAALGWPVGALQAANWALGGALAGLAGVLLAPITGVDVGTGTLLIVPVLAAALIGGLTSFGLTLAGGLSIGVLQAILEQHDGGVSGLANAVPFLVMIVVLVVRGRGLPLRSFVGERLPVIGSGRIRAVPLVAGAAVLALAIGQMSPDWVAAATVTITGGVVVLSTTVVLGYAGQLSLVQMTLAGVSALIAARLAGDLHVPFILTFPLAMLGTVPVGLLVGLPALRTRGVSLAIATLGLAVAIDALVFGNASISGGTNGVTVSADGSLRLLGWDVNALMHPVRYALLSLAGFVLMAVLVANLRRGRAGRRFVAVRSNERAAAALGVDVAAAKLWAFAIAAAIAAVGGVLIAFRFQTVLFSQFSVFGNISTVAYGVVGGIGSAPGALVGGVLVPAGMGSQLLADVSSGWARYIDLVAGILLLATVIAVPDGIVPACGQRLTALAARGAGRRARLPGRLRGGRGAAVRALPKVTDDAPAGHVAARTLEAEGVRVAFGSVVAVDGVSLEVRPGEVVGVIGPNGAGKTTLIDAITGFLEVEGVVRLGGVSLRRSVHLRARAGLGRSFQSLELFEDLTVLDNLRCAGDPRDASAYLVDLVHPRRGNLTAATIAAIDTFGLAEYLDRLPGDLSYGRRRLVAFARAVASEPSILLLDEPCAGLDRHERTEVGQLIRTLAEDRGMGIMLVEHDVDLVRRVSDRLVVMDFGRVIAAGRPDDVLADTRVVEAYLGALDPGSPPPPDRVAAVAAEGPAR